jgi:hypothetical protein
VILLRHGRAEAECRSLLASSDSVCVECAGGLDQRLGAQSMSAIAPPSSLIGKVGAVGEHDDREILSSSWAVVAVFSLRLSALRTR